jgi:predicted dehydrogenase
VNIALVGCGYVADLYAKTLCGHADLKLIGVYDSDRQRVERFAARWKTSKYGTLDEAIGDPRLEAVLNLTNPRSHFDVTRACLEGGKHVYSEKPLAMTTPQAEQLVTLADHRQLHLASAPCSVLSETAQTLWKAIREGAVGKVRLVYANFDEGMIAPQMNPWKWRNESGVPWPAKDEFEVGCTFEHAGYVLTWLAAFFGPALTVSAFASCQIPDKGIVVDSMAPDFSVGCIEYPGDVVARLTCGLVAPRDKSITVVGDEGVLFVGNVRDDSAPVMVRRSKLPRWQAAVVARTTWLQRWLERHISGTAAGALFQSQYPAVRNGQSHIVSRSKPVDFLRGPAEMADAVRTGRSCRLSGRLGAHIVEILEALRHPESVGTHLTTRFSPIDPMPWAI